jgi:hypothetical protein
VSSPAAARKIRAPCPALGCCQAIELGADRVHCGFDDGIRTWNGEHSVDELIKIWLDISKCLDRCLLGIWRLVRSGHSSLLMKAFCSGPRFLWPSNDPISSRHASGTREAAIVTNRLSGALLFPAAFQMMVGLAEAASCGNTAIGSKEHFRRRGFVAGGHGGCNFR